MLTGGISTRSLKTGLKEMLKLCEIFHFSFHTTKQFSSVTKHATTQINSLKLYVNSTQLNS